MFFLKLRISRGRTAKFDNKWKYFIDYLDYMVSVWLTLTVFFSVFLFYLTFFSQTDLLGWSGWISPPCPSFCVFSFCLDSLGSCVYIKVLYIYSYDHFLSKMYTHVSKKRWNVFFLYVYLTIYVNKNIWGEKISRLSNNDLLCGQILLQLSSDFHFFAVWLIWTDELFPVQEDFSCVLRWINMDRSLRQTFSWTRRCHTFPVQKSNAPLRGRPSIYVPDLWD